MENSPEIDFNDLNLLRAGRHLRLSPATKIVVGRDEEDNEKIRRYAKPGHFLLEAIGTGSPMGLLVSAEGDKDIELAAAIVARYCDLKDNPEVEITCVNENDGRKFEVKPAEPDRISELIIK